MIPKAFHSGIAVLVLSGLSLAVSVHLDRTGATVWSAQQVISGRTDMPSSSAGAMVVNGIRYPFTVGQDHSFSISVVLQEGINRLFALIDSDSGRVIPDTIQDTLGYGIRPDIGAFAFVQGRTVHLKARVIENADGSALSFLWRAAPGNPSPVMVRDSGDSAATVIIPRHASPGEYCFDLRVISSQGDTARARTLVTVDSHRLKPFDIATDHARWIDSAVIYGIAPHNFVRKGTFKDISTRMPELKRLGITALWLQPIYPSKFGGQGYDIIDYFGIRPEFGTPADLHDLVRTAHLNGLRVLLDFVPNHSSIHHPYAQDAIKKGSRSHYHDFFQRSKDSARYSSHYHLLKRGEMTFVRYFWEDLVNFDHDNPEVRRMLTEAGKKWITEFDIDGFRIDAAWAVNARSPSFMKEWRLALKRLKPEILLLGEDKATDPESFDTTFDAAYDWTSDTNWISQWVWQTDLDSPKTIFNAVAEQQRADELRASLTNNSRGYAPRARILRFLENNDTYRFLPVHGKRITRMAASLLFSLDGVPLIYAGQEIGAAVHPYEADRVFASHRTIRSQGRHALYNHYRRLIRLRREHPALMDGEWEEVPVIGSGACYAFRRWWRDSHALVIVNMGRCRVAVKLLSPLERMHPRPGKSYTIADALSAWKLRGTATQFDTVTIPVPGFTTRVCVVTQSP